MAFLLIIREPRGQRQSRTAAEGEQAYASMLAYAGDLAARGVLVAAESLKDDTDGVRISIREGKVRLIDGPFTESKEMIGGFFLLDVGTRDEAVALAQRCPAAHFASVEVRQLAPCNEA